MDLEILNKAKEALIPTNTNALQVKNQFSDELTWVYFIAKMAELEAQKRDNIPDTTQEVWFRLLKQQGWGKKKFDEQFQKVLTNPSYGAVKIDEFFNEKVSYSPEEVSKLLEQRINGMIKQGEKILGDKEYGLLEYLNINNQYLKLAIANRLRIRQNSDKMEKYEELIDRAIEIVKAELLP